MLSSNRNPAVKYLMLIKHSEACRSHPIPPGLTDAMEKLVTGYPCCDG
jgi:hypothetical protein